MCGVSRLPSNLLNFRILNELRRESDLTVAQLARRVCGAADRQSRDKVQKSLFRMLEYELVEREEAAGVWRYRLDTQGRVWLRAMREAIA